MKNAFKFLVFMFAMMLLAFACASCEGKKTSDEIIAENNYRYFDVVNFINEGKFVEAKSRIDEVYSNVDYSENDTDSYNKMNLLRLYYEKQNQFDNAVSEVLSFVSESGLLKQANDGALSGEAKNQFAFCVSAVERMFDGLSESKQEEAKKLLGDHLSVE